MRLLLIRVLGLLCLALPFLIAPFAHGADGLGADARGAELDRAVLDTLNDARTHPADYARQLERGEDAGDDGGAWRAPTEDAQDVDEAIDFLLRQAPLPPLRDDARLDAAAMAHTDEQGRTGEVGHGGAGGEGLSERLQHHGLWAGMAAEDISYGYANPRAVVDQLIIDAGVPGRGHRQNIFDPTLQAAGVGCGRHSVYGAMCVIDFAGAIVQR